MSKEQSVISEEFGKSLRALRRTRHMSQTKLSSVSGLSTTYISLLEHGHKNPKLTTLLTLAKALDVEPDLLLKRLQSRLQKLGQAGPKFNDSGVGH